MSSNSPPFYHSRLFELLQKSQAICSLQGQAGSALEAVVFWDNTYFLKKIKLFSKNQNFAILTAFLQTLIMHRLKVQISCLGDIWLVAHTPSHSYA